jgi:hypothetical protein
MNSKATPSETDIQSVLNFVVARATERLGNHEAAAAGWDWLVDLDYRREWIDGSWVHSIRGDEWDRLVFFARGCAIWPIAPDAYAFDAACQVGARMVRDGIELPSSLRKFVTEVLLGEIQRPKVSNRPKRTTILDLHRISFCLAILRLGWLHLGENTNTVKATARRKRLSASRAVAMAFSDSGHHTTQARVKDLCSHEKYKELRQAIEAAGWVDVASTELQATICELPVSNGT